MDFGDFKDARTFCACDQYVPLRGVLISPPFNRELALFWLSYGLSTQALWDLLLSTWYGHQGQLYDVNRNPIDLWSHEGGLDYIDRLAADPERSLRRYLAFGQTTRVNRLRKEHISLATMLHHGRSIKQSETQGICKTRKR